MSASTKLSNSVKALCFLAQNRQVPQSSTTISKHTGVNASKIRKLLSDLAKIGIVSTTQGTSGGFILTREPEDIHLQEIYCAIEDRKAFHLDVSLSEKEENTETSVVNRYFLQLFSDIQVEIEEKMCGITLDSILRQISAGKQ